METSALQILTMAKVIQTAVAPVFLITGIAATLGVLSNRLARIVDRARLLDKRIKRLQDEAEMQELQREMRALLKRSRFIHVAFSASVLSALLVCSVVMMLFISHLHTMDLGITIASCFIAAMALLIAAFFALLGEIFLATRSMRRGMIFADFTQD
ncbi:DUF2721 domain-containing protein [Pseudoalteromonas xiamenensis]|uniref:DUF2721 domain-containing protein n=1 Tax=Pseudoalteromonas xiamenensis TaxID=882626 RepID=UPI0027E5070C|nr:DUF2721 domain-containing protein [Pseudoalteromonas xiamenensis]WMN58528.1 DUF2721 domain-containing protein [Pseudoalteromonas xiamenensis]